MLVALHSDVGNNLCFVIAAIFRFSPSELGINMELSISLCFVSFKTWVYIPKLSFYDKYFKSCSILGYYNTQPVAMAVGVGKNFPLRGFWGLCTRVLSEHSSNLPENFSFLHFFLDWTLMLLGWCTNTEYKILIDEIASPWSSRITLCDEIAYRVI